MCEPPQLCEQPRTRRSQLSYKHPSFLLAVLIIAAAPVFADKIPVDPKSDSKGSASAQKQAELKGLHDLYATGDCDLGGIKQNEVRPASMSNAGASSFSQGDKSGGFVNSEANSGNPPLKVIDLGSNQDNGSDKGKSHGNGNGHDQDGNSGAPAVIAVSEPGSQLLLLAGLAGLGIFFLRRNSFQNASE
jgi:hypothetical protein